MKNIAKLYTQISKRGFSSSCNFTRNVNCNATCNATCNVTCNAMPYFTLFTCCILSISIKEYMKKQLLYTERQNEEIIIRLKRLEEKTSEINDK